MYSMGYPRDCDQAGGSTGDSDVIQRSDSFVGEPPPITSTIYVHKTDITGSQ